MKGKDKGKGKKGKRKGGKDSKGKGKTKNEGKAKDYGKSNAGGQGKGKTLPMDTRKVCGARGHWGRECPQSNLRQVSQAETQSVAPSAVSSGGSQVPQPVLCPATTVRRATYINLDENKVAEPCVRVVHSNMVFDMTYSDGDDEWSTFGDSETGCNTNFMDIKDVPVENFGKKDNMKGGSSPPMEQFLIRGVQKTDMVNVVLDSGADMSVLPLCFKDLGTPLPCKSILRDAQGNKMKGGDLRQAEVLLEDETGHCICLRETCAVSNVAKPLLALGKLLKKGWKMETENDEVKLKFGEFTKVLNFRNHSLIAEA